MRLGQLGPDPIWVPFASEPEASQAALLWPDRCDPRPWEVNGLWLVEMSQGARQLLIILDIPTYTKEPTHA